MAPSTELLSSLIQAEEGSRDLDRAVAIAFKDSARTAWDGRLNEPAYTTSPDAARALVREVIGSDRAMAHKYLPAGHHPHRVWIFKDKAMPPAEYWPMPRLYGNLIGGNVGALHKVEAIAWLICLLRAKDGDAEQ